jgi:hypothetical protein
LLENCFPALISWGFTGRGKWGCRTDLTKALRKLKADQEYKIEVLRDKERLDLKITPAKR